MDNLKYPKEESLLGADALANIVADATSSPKKLLVPDIGQELINGQDEYTVRYSDNGLNAATKVKFNTAAPAVTTNFGFALAIRPEFRQDSRMREGNLDAKFDRLLYADTIGSLSVSGNVIQDSSLLDMEDKILALHKADRNPYSEKFEIRKAFIITDDDTADASSVDITIDGTTTTLTTDGGFGNIAAKINASAAVNGTVVAIEKGSDKVLIIAKTKGETFLVDNGSDITVNEHFLVVNCTDNNYRFVTSAYNESLINLATMSFFFMAQITSSDYASAGGNTSIYANNGDESYAIANNAIADVVTAINGGLTSVHAFAVGASDIYLVEESGQTLKNIRVRSNYAATVELGDYLLAGPGQTPWNWYNVWELFNHKQQNNDVRGPIANVERGADYCEIAISINRSGVKPTVGGASTTVGYNGRVSIFCKKSDVDATLAGKFNTVFGVNNF